MLENIHSVHNICIHITISSHLLFLSLSLSLLCLQDNTINLLKQNLREAIKTKGTELQKVLDAHSRQKAQHARELARLAKSHDDNVIDHDATKTKRDEYQAMYLTSLIECKDLQGRLNVVTDLIANMQEEIRAANFALNVAKDEAKKKEADLRSQLSEAKKQVDGLTDDKMRAQEMLSKFGSRWEMDRLCLPVLLPLLLRLP